MYIYLPNISNPMYSYISVIESSSTTHSKFCGDLKCNRKRGQTVIEFGYGVRCYCPPRTIMMLMMMMMMMMIIIIIIKEQ
jgi:hypothetical protein